MLLNATPIKALISINNIIIVVVVIVDVIVVVGGGVTSRFLLGGSINF